MIKSWTHVRRKICMQYINKSCLCTMFYTVLRPRIICLKYVHPGKRARAQKLYIFSSYTYAFDETFTCIWIILWCISLEWQEAHLDDGFTQTIPPASSLIFKWYRCSSSLPLIGRRARPWLGDTQRGYRSKFFLHLNLVSISFDYWQNINKKRLTFKETNLCRWFRFAQLAKGKKSRP